MVVQRGSSSWSTVSSETQQQQPVLKHNQEYDSSTRATSVVVTDSNNTSPNLRCNVVVPASTASVESQTLVEWVICSAIEDEQKIEEELIFSREGFFTGPHLVMSPRPSPKETPPVQEPYLETSFRVEQLRSLFEIFRVIAPSGLISQRAFWCILEDLIICGHEELELPQIWYQLSSSEIQEVLEEIFGTVENVEWREFLIRGLGLSYPSMKEVLKMRKEFMKYDSNLNENVSFETYNKITLWFEKTFTEDEVMQPHIHTVKRFLYSLFQTHESEFGYMTFLYYFCKDRDPKVGLAKAFALKLGTPIVATDNEYKVYQQQLEVQQNQVDGITTTAKEVLWDVTDDTIQSVSGIFIKEILEKAQEKAIETEKQNQVIEEILEKTENKEPEQYSQGEESEDKLTSDNSTQILFNTFLASSSTDEENIKGVLNAQIKIPREVIIDVLKMSLPLHEEAENATTFGEQSLLMELEQICHELGDEQNCVAVKEFLSHKQTRQLFDTIHKFHAFLIEEKIELVTIANEYIDSLCDKISQLTI